MIQTDYPLKHYLSPLVFDPALVTTKLNLYSFSKLCELVFSEQGKVAEYKLLLHCEQVNEKNVDALFHHLFYVFKKKVSKQSLRQAKKWQTINQMVLDNDLVSEIRQCEQIIQYADAGVSIDKLRVKLNATKFANFIMRRSNLLRIDGEDGLYLYNKETGIYEDGETIMDSLIWDVLNEIKPDAWNSAQVDEIVKILKLKAPKKKRESMLSSDYICFRNTTFNLTELKPICHQPDNLLLTQAPVNFIATANCPLFEEFLNQVFDNDKTTIEFVGEWLGYCLTNEVKAHKMLLAYGDGANGKSTLFNVLRDLLGGIHTSSASFSDISGKFGLEPLLGKRCNICNESGQHFWRSEILKSITSGDNVTVDRKYKKAMDIIIRTKLIFSTNTLPQITDSSYGFSRRLLILPFKRVFKPHEIDPDLPMKLKDEMSGILNFALNGLRRLQKRKFRFIESESMKVAKETYEQTGNPVRHFVQGQLIMNRSSKLSKSAILEAYKTWLSKHKLSGNGTESSQKFWKLFSSEWQSQHGEALVEVKDSQNRYFKNVDWREPEIKEEKVDRTFKEMLDWQTSARVRRKKND